jgi:hemerythrin-like domain-containing protein
MSDAELPVWQDEIERHFTHEIRDHFAAEEATVFPVAQGMPTLAPLVKELITEHGRLREDFERARSRAMNGEQIREFARRLAEHVRKEERQLFEGMQAHLSAAELEHMGQALAARLTEVDESCLLPDERTRVRPKSKD